MAVGSVWLQACGSTQAGPPRLELTLESQIVTMEMRARDDVHVQVDMILHGKIAESRLLVFPETPLFPLVDTQATWDGLPVKLTRTTVAPGTYVSVRGSIFTAFHGFYIPPSSATRHRHEFNYRFSPPLHVAEDGKTGRLIQFSLRPAGMYREPARQIQVILSTGKIPCAKLISLPDSYQGSCESKNVWTFRSADTRPNQDIRLLLPES